jgi:Ni/Fe-hydrogenase subunit HybB-like protein
MKNWRVTFLNDSVYSVSLSSELYLHPPAEPTVMSISTIMGQHVVIVNTFSSGAREAKKEAIMAYEFYKLKKTFS